MTAFLFNYRIIENFILQIGVYMLKASNRAGEAITSSPLRIKGNELYKR
jgi:hypothetical protein